MVCAFLLRSILSYQWPGATGRSQNRTKKTQIKIESVPKLGFTIKTMTVAETGMDQNFTAEVNERRCVTKSSSFFISILHTPHSTSLKLKTLRLVS